LNYDDSRTVLWKKLPDWMEDKQRKIKINHLLSELREKQIIRNEGSYTKPKWVLTELQI
jgi:ATP-dependent DNA helicase RecG